MIIDQLQRAGLPIDTIGRADSEMDAIRQALAWSESGDLLLLITHSKRSGVVSFLESLQSKKWAPGDPVPGLS